MYTIGGGDFDKSIRNLFKEFPKGVNSNTTFQ